MWGGVRSSGIKTTQTAGTAQLLRRECANALAVGVWQSQRVLVLLVPPSVLLYHWSDVRGQENGAASQCRLAYWPANTHTYCMLVSLLS